MHIDVNGTRLWFDVDGLALVPDGADDAAATDGHPRPRRAGRLRPLVLQAVVRAAGGCRPGDLPRPARAWPVGSTRPGRLDVRRLWPTTSPRSATRSGSSDRSCSGTRWVGSSRSTTASGTRLEPGASSCSRRWPASTSSGSSVACGESPATRSAELARRDYGGDEITDAEWARVYAAFGPHVLSDDELTRRVRNPAVGAPGMARMRALDLTADLARISTPTARRRRRARRRHAGRGSAGDRRRSCARDRPTRGDRRRRSLPWLDQPDRLWSVLTGFVTTAARTP